MEPVDVVIAGGGIIGLWTAYEVLQAHPDWTVVLCEKEAYLGEHSTGRNSEVLHAGIYYDHLSLKHTSCLEGNLLWRQFVQKHGINFLDCGKYIVAAKADLTKLEQVYAKASHNNVPGLRWATEKEKHALSEEVACDEAFFSPSSGVLNISECVKVLSQVIEDSGGIILKQRAFKILDRVKEGFVFEVDAQRFAARNLVNAAGHSAVGLRQQLGLSEYKNRYVKGGYLALKKKLHLQHLVYPIPPAHGLGLGVHLTLDTSGAQKFGPHTEDVQQINYAIEESLIDQMYPAIATLFPTVERTSLALAYSGIRSKILRSTGELMTDFILLGPHEHGIDGYFEYLGIESPGVTAAPSLVKRMVSKIQLSPGS